MAISKQAMKLIKDELTLIIRDNNGNIAYTIPIIFVLKALREKGYNITKTEVVTEITNNSFQDPIDWEYSSNKF